MYFLNELKKRNAAFFWYGVLNFVAVITCFILMLNTSTQVNGVNAFLKPLKFYLSIAIFVWTMGWYMFYLEKPLKVKSYNIMAIIVFTYESTVIVWQAANGRLSHFNISTPLYSVLFSIMGLAIVFLTVWTGYICYLFFKKKNWDIPMAYVWGIRVGLMFFVIFAFEGGIMAAILRHTIGGEDGSNGIPVLNWSHQYGDLRIAHFMGMHAMQLLPLFGYYISRNARVVIGFAFTYLVLVVAVLIQALMGLPLL